jgi:mannitol/fructose-specific phosphotransferase system IIA component (Ntr-type)
MHCGTIRRGLALGHALTYRAVLLTEILTPEQVVMPVAARDKTGVIAELTRHLIDRVGGNYAEVLEAVQVREAGGSTGIGFGVAIPHARSPAVGELSVVCGVSRSPVPYDSMDGEPVSLFFLIVAPIGSAGMHVKVLSRIASLVRSESVRKQLCQAGTPDEFYRVLLDAEAR